MVNRSLSDSPFAEDITADSKFSAPSSCVGSNDEYYSPKFVYYRPQDSDYFEGPFTEVQAQFWYKEAFFFNSLEFRLGKDAPVETLEALKERNGRECPFQEGRKNSATSVLQMQLNTLMGRIAELSENVTELTEERFAAATEKAALFNRVSELMDKNKVSEQNHRELEDRIAEMQLQIGELRIRNEALEQFIAAPPRVAACEDGGEEVEYSVLEGGEEGQEEHGQYAEEVPMCEHVGLEVVPPQHNYDQGFPDVRFEVDQLHAKMANLDTVTGKLSRNVDRLKESVKKVDVIGEGLCSEHGVYGRLACLEKSVEDIQEVLATARDGRRPTITSSLSNTAAVPPPALSHQEDCDQRDEEAGSVDERWFSPREEDSGGFSTDTSFSTSQRWAAAAAACIEGSDAATPREEVTTPRPQPAQVTTPGRDEQVDNWETMDAEDEDAAGEEGEEEDTVGAEAGSEGSETDKENQQHRLILEGNEADHMRLIGSGLGLLLQKTQEGEAEIAGEADVERLLAAIKSAKVLHIAEAIKQHFVKPLTCDACATETKPVELRNAIEYFEHLNRAHFKKCGGDRDLVNQYAFLLENFKAAVPVPIALAKRQYAEREKNKPWLKREKTPSPNGKISKKKK